MITLIGKKPTGK